METALIQPNDISTRWSIYVLFDAAEPNETRYVGITCDRRKRISSHRNPKPSDKTHRANWARKVMASGSNIQMETVLDELPLETAKTAEILLIAYHRAAGSRLVNSTDGGDGVLDFSPETRAKISETKRAQMASPEVRAKFAEYARRNVLSAESRAMISASLKGRPRSEETRRKISASHIGITQSAESRAKISASLTGRKQSEETIAKRMATMAAKAKAAAIEDQS